MVKRCIFGRYIYIGLQFNTIKCCWFPTGWSLLWHLSTCDAAARGCRKEGGHRAGDSSTLSLCHHQHWQQWRQVGSRGVVNMREDKNLPECGICAGEGAASVNCHSCCPGDPVCLLAGERWEQIQKYCLPSFISVSLRISISCSVFGSLIWFISYCPVKYRINLYVLFWALYSTYTWDTLHGK